MARKSTIKLLLINESDNEGERLISLFRNAGRVARAQRAGSAEEFRKLLEQEIWDLLIANDKHPELSTEQCIEQLKKHQPEVPAIVIRDNNIEEAFEAGANDVISRDDDQRLIFSAFRELEHLAQARSLAKITERLQDAEQRCEQLMSQSQDAIAYVTDGMIINTNDLFSTRFGYDNPDDLDCLPIIDLINDNDQEKFKGLLKSQLANGAGSTDLAFSGVKKSGDNFDANMQLSNAVIDDEECIQITIKDSESSNNGTVSFDRDPDTGLYNHDFFISQLDSHIKQAAAGTSNSALLFIGIDKFGFLRGRYGITNYHLMIIDIAKFIQQNAGHAQYLTHFCDDSFTLLLPDTGTEQAMEYARTLVEKIGEHVVDMADQSFQCTASIGVLELNNQVNNDPDALIDEAFAACQHVRESADNGGIGNGAFLHVPIKEVKALTDNQTDEEIDTFIEEALEDDRFSLTFQPVVSLRGSSGDHYEVRVVMTDEKENEVAAKDFLASMNFSGVNTRLDKWILLEATKLLADQLNEEHDTHLIINLTTNALQDEGLISWFAVALKAGNISPEKIILQFVEAEISAYLKPARIFADAVKKLGCKTSITGFGLADDPIKTLKHVNADYAKIANKYTNDLDSGGDTQVLKAMVSSINEQNSKAIISGVENAAALAVLWQIGVDYIQGAYLANPSKKMDYEFTDIA